MRWLFFKLKVKFLILITTMSQVKPVPTSTRNHRDNVQTYKERDKKGAVGPQSFLRPAFLIVEHEQEYEMYHEHRVSDKSRNNQREDSPVYYEVQGIHYVMHDKPRKPDSNEWSTRKPSHTKGVSTSDNKLSTPIPFDFKESYRSFLESIYTKLLERHQTDQNISSTSTISPTASTISPSPSTISPWPSTISPSPTTISPSTSTISHLTIARNTTIIEHPSTSSITESTKVSNLTTGIKPNENNGSFNHGGGDINVNRKDKRPTYIIVRDDSYDDEPGDETNNNTNNTVSNEKKIRNRNMKRRKNFGHHDEDADGAIKNDTETKSEKPSTDDEQNFHSHNFFNGNKMSLKVNFNVYPVPKETTRGRKRTNEPSQTTNIISQYSKVETQTPDLKLEPNISQDKERVQHKGTSKTETTTKVVKNENTSQSGDKQNDFQEKHDPGTNDAIESSSEDIRKSEIDSSLNRGRKENVLTNDETTKKDLQPDNSTETQILLPQLIKALQYIVAGKKVPEDIKRFLSITEELPEYEDYSLNPTPMSGNKSSSVSGIISQSNENTLRVLKTTTLNTINNSIRTDVTTHKTQTKSEYFRNSSNSDQIREKTHFNPHWQLNAQEIKQFIATMRSTEKTSPKGLLKEEKFSPYPQDKIVDTSNFNPYWENLKKYFALQGKPLPTNYDRERTTRVFNNTSEDKKTTKRSQTTSEPIATTRTESLGYQNGSIELTNRSIELTNRPIEKRITPEHEVSTSTEKRIQRTTKKDRKYEIVNGTRTQPTLQHCVNRTIPRRRNITRPCSGKSKASIILTTEERSNYVPISDTRFVHFAGEKGFRVNHTGVIR